MSRDKVEVLLPTQDVTKSIEVGAVTKKAVNVSNQITIENALKNKNNSLQITVENTHTSTGDTVTIKAGNNYPNKILGDLSVALPAATPSSSAAPLAPSITPIIIDDISRFENKDGSINLDFSANFTGNVWAVAKRAGILPAQAQ